MDAVAVTKISIAASAGAETTRAFAAVDNSLSFRSTEYRYHKQNRARLYNRTRSSYFWDAFDPALDFQGSASHWPARVRQASSLSGRFCTSKEHRRGDDLTSLQRSHRVGCAARVARPELLAVPEGLARDLTIPAASISTGPPKLHAGGESVRKLRLEKTRGTGTGPSRSPACNGQSAAAALHRGGAFFVLLLAPPGDPQAQARRR